MALQNSINDNDLDVLFRALISNKARDTSKHSFG